MTHYLGNIRMAALATALCASQAAFGANPVGNADAYDLSVHINLVGVTQLNVDAQTSASLVNVVASASDSQTLPSFSAVDPLSLISLDTGALSSEVEYVGGPLSAIAARASVDDLDLTAHTALVDILGLSAGVVTATTALSGNCPPAAPGINTLLGDFVFGTGFDAGNLHGGGGGDGGDNIGGLPPSGTHLIDPFITILGIDVPNLPLDPPPNTTIDLGQLGIVGAVLILNEQTRTGDGVHSLAVASNAIHLTINVAQLVTAEVIIAHAGVSLACP
jgi:hypothetical protein